MWNSSGKNPEKNTRQLEAPEDLVMASRCQHALAVLEMHARAFPPRLGLLT